jgi:acetyl esterase
MSDRGIQVVREHLAKLPPSNTLTIEQRRSQYERAERVFPTPADVAIETVQAPERPAEWLRPPGVRSDAAVLYLHGGGYVIGSPRSHRHLAAAIGRAAGTAALLLDYRLAPEHPFPAALEDSLAAVRAVDELGLDSDRVAVYGDSAGGGLAAVIARELRGALRHQALVYPVCDARLGATDSYARYADGYFMTAADMSWFLDHYAAGVDPTDPRLSPLAAEDVSGAAPATIVLAGCDPLRDEGVAYARKLEAAGVDVELREYPDQIHPFVLLAGIIDAGREARSWLAQRLGAALRA